MNPTFWVLSLDVHFRRKTWLFLLMLCGLVWAGPGWAHLDPPRDPALLTQVDIDSLVFLTDVDDGTNGLAELRVVYTVNWGGDHGSTVYMWSKDHNFDDVAPPYTAVPPNLTIGTHMECTPAASVTVNAKAYESDSGVDPFANLLIAAGGGAIGGVLGNVAPGPGTAAGAGAGAALAAGLLGLAADFFDSDDPLSLGSDFTSTFIDSRVQLSPGPCSEDSLGSTVPEQDGYCSAAEETDDSEVAARYTEYATYGVDSRFPFGRSASYSAGRYAYLESALTAADYMVLEAGGTSDIAAKQTAIRTAAVDFGQIVAQATFNEGYGAVLSAGVLTAAQSALSAGDQAALYGDYSTALDHYEQVGALILPEMFPEFVNPTDPCAVASVPASSALSRFVLIWVFFLIGGPLGFLVYRRGWVSP